MLMRQADDDLSSITGSHYYCEADDGIRTMSEQPPPLQGRSREKLELLKAYSRVVQTHKSQVVFVHGMSGQGKTSIVDTLREPVCDANGYFCCGKFFSNSGIQEPHSAITAAFSDLCDFVLQSHDFEQSRARIKGALTAHNDGHLLSRSINLAPFLNESPETPVETTTFSRFRGACKSFLLAMASQQHPVVLFLDDIQWMDNGSQRLIDMFINDLDLKHVMFVLAYRDEEVNSALQEIIQTTRKAGVTDIQLTNLDLSSVRSMLAWHLGLPATSDMDELSELTLRRTGGNPFDVSLFLEAIGTKKYLLSNKRFDLDKIRSCSQLSETAAELMYQKVHRVPAEMQTILTVASMLGYTFEEQGVILDVVKRIPTCDGQASHHPAKAMQSLLHAVELGFIETVKEGYQFTHDKLQTAFLNLVSETTREHYHLLIGQAYLAHDKFIYKAAVHLNAAPEFLVNKDRHIQLARINLGGSRCCQKISAFDKAGSLLHQGIDLLNLAGVMWAHEVLDLSLELTESLARMALVVGDFATCSAAIKDAMRHVDTREAKVKLMIINVECRMANNEMEESVKASTDTLAELGVNLPRKVTMRHVICKVVKLKFLMSGMTNEDILRLPTVQDESITSSIRLLIYIHLYCMLMNQEELAVYAALHAMDLTLKHGLSTYASSALSVFGIAVLSMGNHERAYNLGTLALQLMGQTPSREADCPTIGNVNTLLRHWKEPIADLCGPLYEAASIGFGKGELIYSTYCYSQAQGMEGVAGVPLGVLEESLKIQYRRIHALGQEELLVWIRPQMQYVANFRSSSTDWRQLALMSGEFMNFDKHLREANASSNNIVKVTALMIRAKLENLFGFHRMARETFEELEMIGDVTHMTYAGTIWSWGAGVANYESYRTDRKRKYLRKARKYKKLLKQRNAFGPNASTFLAHLNMKETYLRRIRTKQIDTSYDDETLQLLDHSLERFMVDGNPCKPYFVSASAFVDAGFIAERMGRLAQAERYFERAKIIYHGSWGAFAPAAWLNEKCMVLRNKDESTNSYESVSDRWVGGIVNVYEKCEFA